VQLTSCEATPNLDATLLLPPPSSAKARLLLPPPPLG
tara:strand:+ start:418 stop:528 length:111 start_codon:yes stop_codon:yes gene_type:complete